MHAVNIHVLLEIRRIYLIISLVGAKNVRSTCTRIAFIYIAQFEKAKEKKKKKGEEKIAEEEIANKITENNVVVNTYKCLVGTLTLTDAPRWQHWRTFAAVYSCTSVELGSRSVHLEYSTRVVKGEHSQNFRFVVHNIVLITI